MPAVVAQGLTKLYANKRGIEELDLAVEEGEVFGLLGLNGSGKSTLLKVLATQVRPQAGTFSVLGHPGHALAMIRPLLGLAAEGVAHFGDLTGLENAWFYASVYGLPEEEVEPRLRELFVWAGLAEVAGSPVSTYSYGMKRKLALVEAMAHRPRLLLLDEPSLGLDFPSREALYKRLRDLAAGGTTVLLASNDVLEAQAVCDRVAFLHQGRVTLEGRPADLLGGLDQCSEVVVSLVEALAPTALRALRALPGVEHVSVSDRKLVVLVRDGQAALAGIVRAIGDCGGRIEGLQVKDPDLGDVYLHHTGESWRSLP